MTTPNHSGKAFNIELFPCSGGMAKGFKNAGIDFDLAIEWKSDHCDSYKHNIGHRPLCMDVRDFAQLVKQGQWQRPVNLLVADPPCTPWSRAGKRLGTDDERDMLAETCNLIALLQPETYLIGNVPGLDDGPNLPIVQQLIGGLARFGYCTADFARLNASNYGVPQHRVRPFWFGHKRGPCIQWPAPTHGDPIALRDQMTLPGVDALIPWVTCRQALGHLPLEELGRPVKLRKRDLVQVSTSDEKSAELDTFTIQDGRGGIGGLNRLDEPSHSIVKNTHGNGSILVINDKHRPLSPDEPSQTIRSGGEGHSAPQVVITMEPHHPPSQIDEPAMTIRAGCGGGANRALQLDGDSPRKGGPRSRDRNRTAQGNRVGNPDVPSATVVAKAERIGASADKVLTRPWDRPATTVQADDRLSPPGHHDLSFAVRSLPNAIVISEKAATILQGFPEDWLFVGASKDARYSQIGQAMPPPLAGAVARSVVRQQSLTRADEPSQVPVTPIKSSRKRATK